MSKKIEPKTILAILENIDNDDESLEVLQKGAELYCSAYDLCEGYKCAIRMTVLDQYENHAHEQSEDDLDELYNILTQ